MTKIIAAGLRKAGGSEHDVQQAMDEEALRELPRLEKRTGYLAMLGNLATLAGLLGTITGLIKSFAGVAGVDPSMKATMLSKGISEAMNCTAFGLGTGIVASRPTPAQRHDPGRARRHQPGHGRDAEPGRRRPQSGGHQAAVLRPMATTGALYGARHPRRQSWAFQSIQADKSGKKSVNADLNLVPYIDLLTCMVAFLLITAVWSQLARLEAHQKGQGQAGEDTPPEKIFKLVVVVNGEGFNLVAGRTSSRSPRAGTTYDFEKLGTELKKFKDTPPGQDRHPGRVGGHDQVRDAGPRPWTRH